MKPRYLYIIVLLFIFSCEDRIEKSLKVENSDLLVVEAVLTNENQNHKITLTHPYYAINGKAIPAAGAGVFVIEGSNVVYSVTEDPPGSGEYFTEEMTAVFGRQYTLLVQYQGKIFSALSNSVPVEPLESIQYQRATNDFYRLSVTDSGNEPNYIDYSISWNSTPVCLPGELCEGRVVYYDLKTIDVNSLFKPDQKDFTFPVGSIVIRKKYSVSPGYKSFLRSVLSETEWRGGVFDIQRANATSNLSEGAIGYFAVSSVVSDTTIIAEKP